MGVYVSWTKATEDEESFLFFSEKGEAGQSEGDWGGDR